MEQNKIHNVASHIVKIIYYSTPTTITRMMGAVSKIVHIAHVIVVKIRYSKQNH